MSVLAATASAVDALVNDLTSETPTSRCGRRRPPRSSTSTTRRRDSHRGGRMLRSGRRSPCRPRRSRCSSWCATPHDAASRSWRAGAGSGLSGGASATADQLVISTERLTRIIDISPLDEVAVVEPGVLERRTQRAPGAARPLLRARSRKLADLVDRRQHRHERGRTAVREVRRHPGVGAGPRCSLEVPRARDRQLRLAPDRPRQPRHLGRRGHLVQHQLQDAAAARVVAGEPQPLQRQPEGERGRPQGQLLPPAHGHPLDPRLPRRPPDPQRPARIAASACTRTPRPRASRSTTRSAGGW